MNEREKREEPGKRINQFIIECLFSKYFEEEKEIASPPQNLAGRNDKVVRIPQ